MAQPGRILHVVRQPFRLRERLADYLVGRLLSARARRHLADGLPPMAVFGFDFIGREIAMRGQFEREDLAVLADFLSPLASRFAGAVTLDVGANIGNHSLYFAKLSQTVHAFEPNPRTFAVLAANAMLAGNIIVHNVGLGAEPGTLTLHFDPLNVGEATVLADAASGALATERVSIETLDGLLSELGNVALIKIDVEGFEPEVIKGAAALIAAHRPVILFEQNPPAFTNGRSETAELLQAAGYKLCAPVKRHVGHGLFGHLFATLRKLAGGISYDVVEIDRLSPSHYPMILAVDDADLALLRNRGE